MPIRFRNAFAFIAAALLGAGAVTLAQDSASTKPKMPSPEEQQQMMAAAMAAAKPGPAHATLAKLAGDWTMEAHVAMPGMPGATAKGTAHGEMVLGGRFMQFAVDADPWPGLTERTNSLTYYGHDNRKDEFFMWGVDTLGTYAVTASGKHTDDANKIEMTGMNEEPGYGTQPFGWSVTIDSENQNTHTISFPGPDGKLTPMMTMVFTRVTE